jgi:hypothetical protein
MALIAGHDRSPTLLLPESPVVRFIAACVNGLDLTVAGFAHVDPKRTGRPELRGGGRLRQRARSHPARGRGTRHSNGRGRTHSSAPNGVVSRLHGLGKGSRTGGLHRSDLALDRAVRLRMPLHRAACKTVAATRARAGIWRALTDSTGCLPRCPRPAWSRSACGQESPLLRARPASRSARVPAAAPCAPRRDSGVPVMLVPARPPVAQQ